AGGAVLLHQLPPDQGSVFPRRPRARARARYGRRTTPSESECPMTRLADRTARIATSQTMKVTATVDRLRREGVEVFYFGAGEPDFGTPDFINAAAKQAIDEHFSKYTPVAGTAELKRAICARYKADYGVQYQDNQVIMSAGGKQALFNTALTLFGPGDEVVVHAPYWPTLTEQVKLAEATPVVVQTSAADGFAITAGAMLG